MGMHGWPQEKGAGEGGSPVLSHLVRGKSEWCEERPLAVPAVKGMGIGERGQGDPGVGRGPKPVPGEGITEVRQEE